MHIEECWEIIDKIVRDSVPDVSKTLNHGASKDEINNLQDDIGIKLPDDFIKSLLIHNGQNDPTRLKCLFNYNHIMSIKEIIAGYNMFKEIFEQDEFIDWIKPDKIINKTWDIGWIKFTECEGDGFVLDMQPGLNGIKGQIFYRAHDDNTITTTADSYSDFLTDIAIMLKENQFIIKNGVIELTKLNMG
jgi:cell wall assembly regulator SMI1